MATRIASLLTCALLHFPAYATAGALEDVAAHDQVASGLAADEEVLVTLRIPIHSPLFADTPVAVVDDEPITVRDLTAHLATVHAARESQQTSLKKNYASLLDRVIATHLIVREARNMGLDETADFQQELEAFSEQLLISSLMAKQLRGVEPDPEEVEGLYRQMAREFLLSTVRFSREEDALLFRERLESGAGFDELVTQFLRDTDAEAELTSERYLKLKDMLPQIAQNTSSMEVGAVSQIFRAGERFLLFRVDDIRPYDDPRLKEEARRTILAPLRRQKAAEYADLLESRYATIDERLLKRVSFEPKQTGFLWFRKTRPVDYEALLADSRVLATVHGDEPLTITVADLAAKLEKSFFHGVDKALARRSDLNSKKRITFKNMLFTRTARIEATRQGLDQTEEYLSAVEEHARSRLFGAFVERAISPDVDLQEEEIRRYYEGHLDEFSTPRMFRMNDLVFYAEDDAERALARLQKRADFQWVSANSSGQVDKDAQGIVRFDNAVLSATALPEELRAMAEAAKEGDSLLYESPDGYFHVISIRKVVPPKPQDYEDVRRDIGDLLSNEKLRELIDDWVNRLKEAYETRIFVAELPN